MLGCVGNAKGRAVMRDRESWLAATMIELADTGAVEFDEAAHVHGFAGRLAELLSPAEVAVLMTARRGHPAVATGSSERAAGLARLEASGMAGPCTECHRAGSSVRQESLAAATTRWPEFAAAARTARRRSSAARSPSLAMTAAASSGDGTLPGPDPTMLYSVRRESRMVPSKSR